VPFSEPLFVELFDTLFCPTYNLGKMSNNRTNATEFWKFIIVVVLAAIPFILWDLGTRFLHANEWARYLFFVIFTVGGVYSTAGFMALIQTKARNTWHYAGVGICTVLTIICLAVSLGQISFFADKWGWWIWIIGLILWVALIVTVLYPKWLCKVKRIWFTQD
jgi:hypothetical protein